MVKMVAINSTIWKFMQKVCSDEFFINASKSMSAFMAKGNPTRKTSFWLGSCIGVYWNVLEKLRIHLAISAPKQFTWQIRMALMAKLELWFRERTMNHCYVLERKGYGTRPSPWIVDTQESKLQKACTLRGSMPIVGSLLTFQYLNKRIQASVYIALT